MILLWLQKQFKGREGRLAAYIASFLFVEEFHGWPSVRHIAPGVLVMKAPYIGPRRVQSFSGFKPLAFTGLAAAALYFVVYDNIAATRDVALGNAGLVGVLLACASYPFWKLAHKTRLVIRFDQGAISWKEPPAYPIPGWGRKHVVKPEEPRRVQVVRPHRWADEEARKHADWRASHPAQPGPRPLFQTASELVMNTGPGDMHWRTIAEFCNDLSGQQAHRLEVAIDTVTDRAAEELEKLRREAAE